jgi:hypothetical protein
MKATDQIKLHLACLIRDGKILWHLAGIKRALFQILL